MGDNGIDQASFASILEGVRKMREAYEPVPTLPTPAVSSNQNVKESAPIAAAPAPVSAQPVAAPISASNSVSASRNRPHNGADLRGTGQRRVRQNIQTYTSIQVANSQKGNPLLESPAMKLTAWTYNPQILLDYYINATLQVLFLSLKYHKLRPEYVWRRIEKLNGGSSATMPRQESDQVLRVLLVVVDIDLPQEVIRALLGICIKHDLSMVVAWSFEEAGNYVAYFKQNEMARSRIESSIQGIKKDDYNSTISSTLTTVRAVNKTDVINLLANCNSFKQVVLLATQDDQLGNIQGLGDRKLHNLKTVFSEPFILNKEYKETTGGGDEW